MSDPGLISSCGPIFGSNLHWIGIVATAFPVVGHMNEVLSHSEWQWSSDPTSSAVLATERSGLKTQFLVNIPLTPDTLQVDPLSHIALYSAMSSPTTCTAGGPKGPISAGIPLASHASARLFMRSSRAVSVSESPSALAAFRSAVKFRMRFTTATLRLSFWGRSDPPFRAMIVLNFAVSPPTTCPKCSAVSCIRFPLPMSAFFFLSWSCSKLIRIRLPSSFGRRFT